MSGEREAIVRYLRRGSDESLRMSRETSWWRFKLRFANLVAAAAQLRLSRAIERGDHLRTSQEGEG